MFSSLATGVKDLGLRFTVSALLPFTLLAAFGFAIVAMVLANPGTDPATAIRSAGTTAGLPGLVIMLVSAFVVAVVTQPFQIAVVRLLEGYWGVSGYAGRARAIGVELQRRRQHRLLLALRRAEFAAERDDAVLLRAQLDRFPAPGELLPTTLGNALRAGEQRAGERYGLDTVRAWSRLYYLLPETFQRDVAELHGQVDGSARLTVALVLAGTGSAPVLAQHGWWNMVWVAALSLAAVAYRGGVAAAANLTDVLCAAFDLHRFELIRAMHLPLPKTRREELSQAVTLVAFWTHSPEPPVPLNLAYEHPPHPPPAAP
jgi:hypothetical protein